VLDRWISGAGAVTDGADRSVRLLIGGWRGGSAMTRPGSLVVAALLLVLAGVLVAAGLEVTDPTTPRPLDPAQVSIADDLGDRTYATVSGSISTSWVETFQDDNRDGSEDGSETGNAWYYWLVDPVGRRGVTVRSTRPPAEILTFHGRGIVVDDPNEATEDFQPFHDEVARAGIAVDGSVVVDTTVATGTTVPVDLRTTALPAAGTAVELTGSRTGGYLAVCGNDDDRDGRCDADEEDRFEVVVFDPVSRRGIRVIVRRPPDFSEATVTGLLRREERIVDDAQISRGFDFSELGLIVSDRYLLDETAPASSAPLAYLLALACVLAAGTILVGLAGGYLIFRRTPGLPVASASLGPGERMPLRVSGILRTPTGRDHVRETPADLVRFSLGRPIPVEADGGDAVSTVLLVERTGHPEGVALIGGEVGRVSAGEAMALRGARPAIRVTAGTGPLILSFDTTAERDRAAAEILAETGLGPDGTPLQTP
jgi:hypothetical protein